MDADDINIRKWDTNLIVSYLAKDTWDSLSFNREDYYDIWALLYEDYKHHCWGFGNHSPAVVEHMKKDITNKLRNMDTETDDLFPCYSAFNGFAIYRSDIFKNCFCYRHFSLLF